MQKQSSGRVIKSKNIDFDKMKDNKRKWIFLSTQILKFDRQLIVFTIFDYLCGVLDFMLMPCVSVHSIYNSF